MNSSVSFGVKPWSAVFIRTGGKSIASDEAWKGLCICENTCMIQCCTALIFRKDGLTWIRSAAFSQGNESVRNTAGCVVLFLIYFCPQEACPIILNHCSLVMHFTCFESLFILVNQNLPACVCDKQMLVHLCSSWWLMLLEPFLFSFFYSLNSCNLSLYKYYCLLKLTFQLPMSASISVFIFLCF